MVNKDGFSRRQGRQNGDRNRRFSSRQFHPHPFCAPIHPLRTYGASLCNKCNTLQPRGDHWSLGFGHSLDIGPWSLVIRHPRSIRATPARRTNPPKAKRTQAKAYLALSRTLFCPTPRTFDFDETNPPPARPCASGATPASSCKSQPHSPW